MISLFQLMEGADFDGHFPETDGCTAYLTSKPQTSKRERELDIYGLTEDEKNIARKEGYAPWDFEEDEMDKDSYYSDDT